MKVFWHKNPPPGNLGDVLNPVLLGKLGVSVEWAPRHSAELLAIGSVIDATQPGMIVWGSGAMSRDATPHPDATYLAVRGPVTREIVIAAGGECPRIYGDPALLLPLVHATSVEKRHGVGFVRHYVDGDPPPAHVDLEISPLNRNPLTVVDAIRSCETIVSSSLHGLVVAQAYGIPWRHRECAALKGDGTKFEDFIIAVRARLEFNGYQLGDSNVDPLAAAMGALTE